MTEKELILLGRQYADDRIPDARRAGADLRRTINEALRLRAALRAIADIGPIALTGQEEHGSVMAREALGWHKGHNPAVGISGGPSNFAEEALKPVPPSVPSPKRNKPLESTPAPLGREPGSRP